MIAEQTIKGIQSYIVQCRLRKLYSINIEGNVIAQGSNMTTFH